MKKYERKLDNIPIKLKSEDNKRKFYLDLYNNNNEVKPRWNTLRESGIKVVREYLLDMTNRSCAYCGKRISDSTMDVEHFLPKCEFPYLAYCIDNLLPSCKVCNQNYKGNFIPIEIKSKKIIEKCVMNSQEYDYIYNKEQVLNELCSQTRIIEPTFDIISEHLEFDPEFFLYTTKSNIGKETNKMFFDKSEFIELLEKMSNVVKYIVKGNGSNNDEIINALIELEGYEVYYRRFYEYWNKEKQNNRL